MDCLGLFFSCSFKCAHFQHPASLRRASAPLSAGRQSHREADSGSGSEMWGPLGSEATAVQRPPSPADTGRRRRVARTTLLLPFTARLLACSPSAQERRFPTTGQGYFMLILKYAASVGAPGCHRARRASQFAFYFLTLLQYGWRFLLFFFSFDGTFFFVKRCLVMMPGPQCRSCNSSINPTSQYYFFFIFPADGLTWFRAAWWHTVSAARLFSHLVAQTTASHFWQFLKKKKIWAGWKDVFRVDFTPYLKAVTQLHMMQKFLQICTNPSFVMQRERTPRREPAKHCCN